MDAKPQNGDRILIFKPHRLQLILSGSKTLEVRAVNYRPGRYWLGCNGRIYAAGRLGSPFPIRTEREWERLRDQHRMSGDKLPYETTWGIPILKVVKRANLSFEHPRGAINIVKYRK